MNNILALSISYFLGSIPTGYLFGKIYKGIDIRRHGSGNVGATNTFRVLGKIPGTIVLIIDILKGTLAVTLLGDILGVQKMVVRILLGLAAVSGHNWTVFLQFKGGKGIATSFGVLIGLTIEFASLRPVLLICILSWLCFFLVFRYVSVASIVASTLLPLAMILTHQSFAMVILGVIFCFFVVLRHRSNIKRLLSGQEPKVKFPFKKHVQ